jgi:hypothetical protein
MPFMRDGTIGTNRDSFVGKLLNASYSERTNTVPPFCLAQASCTLKGNPVTARIRRTWELF